jgi:hypothetical protein
LGSLKMFATECLFASIMSSDSLSCRSLCFRLFFGCFDQSVERLGFY